MNKIASSILVVIIFFSCDPGKSQEVNGLESVRNVKNENVALANQLFAHFNRHEWEKMAALYADTAEFKDPSLGVEIVKQTRQQIVAHYRELEQAFPDVHDEVIQIYPSGDEHVIVEFISTGTAPDSSKFKLPICSILTIENGKITKDFTYYDL